MRSDSFTTAHDRGGLADRNVGPLIIARQSVARETADLLAPPDLSLRVPPATDRGTWAPARVHAETVAALRRRAESDLGEPWPVPLAHDYARFFRDGERTTYEHAVFARQDRLSRAAVLAAVTLDSRWIDEVSDSVTLLCEQSSWCWPAHDDTFRVHGAVVPTVTDPCVDLGAGEAAGQLAWIDHLLGGPLDDQVPGLRARIRHEVDRRALTPFLERRDWPWLGLGGDVHNWSPWIHGNLLVATLRLVDDAPRRAHLVDLVIDGLDRYLAAIPPDGAIDEGYSYWWNGACRALEALDLLRYATRGVLGGIPDGGPRQTVAFPHRIHLGGDWHLNHADGQARQPRQPPWHALHRAARRVGDAEAQAHAAAHRRPGGPVADETQGLGRLLHALTDPDWLAASAGSSPLPRDVWLPSTQVLVARPVAGSPAGLTVAVKGGHNGEHHNHDDIGSAVVALAGVPVLVDAGRPTYTAQTFGPDRYAIWTMHSGWHNVPEIRSTAQGHGRDFAARDVSITIEDSATSMTLDLAGAYPRTDVRRWTRTARLDRTTGRVTIRDAWELDPSEPSGSTHLRWLVAGDVRVGDGRVEITALADAGSVQLSWEPANTACTAVERRLDDPMLTEVWGDRLTRLDLDVTASGPVGVFVLTVEQR